MPELSPSATTRAWLRGLAAAVGVWLAVTCLIVPALIAAAYAGGDHLPLLGQLLEGRATHPLGDYLSVWWRLAPHGLLWLLVGWLVAWSMTRPAFYARCVGPATPGTLGAIRMWVCGILLAMILNERLADLARFSEAFRRPMGFMGMLYVLPLGVDRLAASEAGLRAFQLVVEAVLALALIGWRSRVTVPLAALGTLTFFGLIRQYSFFWHQGLVTTYVLAVLAFTPCGDGWSLDRLIRLGRGRPVPPADQATARYGWARYACWIAIALPYVAAGLSKLRNVGWDWWHAGNMRRFFYGDTLNPVQFDWQVSLHLANAPDAVFAFLGMCGVFGEALFGLVLVSRLARRVFPAAMVTMHLGISLLQNILFPDLILVHAVFYNWARARRALGHWLTRHRGTLQVLYDGHCTLCQGTVRVLRALDLFGRVEPLDFRRMDLAAFNAGSGLSLTAEAVEREMVVVHRGQAVSGFDGYRVLAGALPLGWVVLPWLWMPGVAAAGRRVYALVARNRPTLLACGEHCAIHPEPVAPALATPAAGPDNVRPALGAAALWLVLFFCWFYRVEFYPLTAMQMYTEKRRLAGDIVYYRPLARQARATEPSRKAFRQMMGTLSHNARYRPMFKHCFGTPEQVDRCSRFFTQAAVGYNQQVPTDTRIVEIEIQRWVASVADPRTGHLLGRVQLEIPGSGAVQP